jgi:hypothetical protein
VWLYFEHGQKIEKKWAITSREKQSNLNIWAQQEGLSDENKAEAARRMLECFERRASELDLSGLRLLSLPEQIGNLTQLMRLDLYRNQLQALPDCFANLVYLTQLTAEDNSLTALPDWIGNLTCLTG